MRREIDNYQDLLSVDTIQKTCGRFRKEDLKEGSKNNQKQRETTEYSFYLISGKYTNSSKKKKGKMGQKIQSYTVRVTYFLENIDNFKRQ